MLVVPIHTDRGGGVWHTAALCRPENPFCARDTLDAKKRFHKPPPDGEFAQQLRRLRRPTGPQRAAMCEMPDEIL